MQRLATAGSVDGVYLDLHGAMVTEHLDDGEGELLARVRKVVGPKVPVVASLEHWDSAVGGGFSTLGMPGGTIVPFSSVLSF